MFIQKNFLLKTKTAQKLYFEHAQKMPIIDYHCHLPPAEIAENKRWKNITELWLSGDHYKWRAMRTFSVPERFITGDASDKEKFEKYAETVFYAIGNPLYHWTHLELSRYFNINDILSPATAHSIWEKANGKLADSEFSARSLIKKFNVRFIGTTDDPADDLHYHKQIANIQGFNVSVCPTFRPDGAVKIELASFIPWLNRLEKAVGFKIDSRSALFRALSSRMDYFAEHGCLSCDHGLDRMEYEAEKLSLKKGFNGDTFDEILDKRLNGGELQTDEIIFYKSCLLRFLGKEYAKRGWVMQLHIGALRNNNTKYFEKLGADTGFDSIDDRPYAHELSAFLNDLDYTDELPKTVLYNLNPVFNYMLASMAGNFQSDIRGKIQFGSGWWFNDQKDGMEAQLKALANLGQLSCFIGMLTDSRSFLSYTRHEYFRRILCAVLGQWIEDGEFPADIAFAGKITEDICYNNALQYFGIQGDSACR